MKLIGLGKLGRDAEIRYMTSGTPVANLSLAWDWGKKNTEGKRATQWLDGHFYGPIAEKLAPMLLKGTEVFIDAKDVRIETFDKKDGQKGFKLSAAIQDLTIVSKKKEETPF